MFHPAWDFTLHSDTHRQATELSGARYDARAFRCPRPAAS
jgi:hypothetical protein